MLTWSDTEAPATPAAGAAGTRVIPPSAASPILPAVPALWGIVLAREAHRGALAPARAGTKGERADRLRPTTVPRRTLDARLADTDQVITPERTVLVGDAASAGIRPSTSRGPVARLRVLPCGRGTGPAILWGVCWVSRRDPEAVVALFPEERFVHPEPGLLADVARAADVAGRRPELLVVLGVEPDRPAGQRGWILPGEPLPDAPGCYRVGGVWERPSEARARIFFDSGFLLDSGVVVARAAALRALGRRCLPDVSACLDRMASAGAHAARDQGAARRDYAETRPADFTADALTRDLGSLVVLAARGISPGLDGPGETPGRARVEPGWLAA